MQPIFLTQKLDRESALKGEIKALAYSGAPIANHGPFKNLIIDVATLSIAKEKTPILRDHDPSLVLGHGVVYFNESEVHISGVLSKKSVVAQEIMALAEDGFDWEMSLGIFDGELIEVENEEFNGFHVEQGFVIKNGVLREVSVVALGADMNTSAHIFSQEKGDLKMEIKMSQELYAKLACACGGDKDTKPEDLADKAEKTKLETEEAIAKIEQLEEQIEKLEEAIEQKEAEIEAIKEEEEVEMRAASLKSAADEKGIKLSVEKIAEASKSKESHALLLSVIKEMEVAKKIDQKFSKKLEVSTGAANPKTSDEIRLSARQLIKEGKAKDMIEAIALVEVK